MWRALLVFSTLPLACAQEVVAPAPPEPARIAFTARIGSETEVRTIRGSIESADAKALASVGLGTGWFWDSGDDPPWRPWASDVKRTPGHLVVQLRPGSCALFAFDADTRSGAFHLIQPGDEDRSVHLVLQPLTEVRGRIRCSGATPSWAKATVFVSRDGEEDVPVAAYYYSNGSAGGMRLLLPKGSHRVLLKGTGAQQRFVPVAIDGSKAVLDLGDIGLEPTAIASGKVPETWNVTAARGVSKDVTLADYRGRWVIIEFWGYW